MGLSIHHCGVVTARKQSRQLWQVMAGMLASDVFFFFVFFFFFVLFFFVFIFCRFFLPGCFCCCVAAVVAAMERFAGGGAAPSPRSRPSPPPPSPPPRPPPPHVCSPVTSLSSCSSSSSSSASFSCSSSCFLVVALLLLLSLQWKALRGQGAAFLAALYCSSSSFASCSCMFAGDAVACTSAMFVLLRAGLLMSRSKAGSCGRSGVCRFVKEKVAAIFNRGLYEY